MAEISGIHKERAKLAKILPLSTPYTLNIFITSYCNFKCNYCFHTLPKAERIEKYGPLTHMSLETFRATIDSLKNFPNKLKTILISGHGEPLLNPHVSEMVRYAVQSNMSERVEIITNASVLTHELSDALIEAGLNYLRVSVQGISAEKYKAISGVDIDFERFVEQLRYFYKRKKGYNCKVYCKTMDVALDEGEEAVFYKLFQDICDIINIEKAVVFDEDVEYHGMERAKLSKNKNSTFGGGIAVCPIPFYTVDVFQDGLISPCHVRNNITLGDVQTIGVYNAWNSLECRNLWLQLLSKEGWNRCCTCHFKDGLLKDGDDIDLYRSEIAKKIRDAEKICPAAE